MRAYIAHTHRHATRELALQEKAPLLDVRIVAAPGDNASRRSQELFVISFRRIEGWQSERRSALAQLEGGTHETEIAVVGHIVGKAGRAPRIHKSPS